MENYLFTTENPIGTNEETMTKFLDDHFYNVFDEKAQVLEDEGTCIEVQNGDGKLWRVHAGGDGDFRNHKIRFESLT
tara:strand:+ start:54 stop:284 length:231 start_codon:yes stop_codon:yes gene_type:complete